MARLWSRGASLYGPVAWVDRPQGLLLAYRLVAATGWDPTVRLLAMLAAAVTTAAAGAAAWALAGRRAALIAAALFAVLSPAPHLEGFTANGELLAAAFTTTAVAAAAWWMVRGDRRLLVLAGAMAAIGPLMKQSAIDGLVAVAVLLVLEAIRRRRSPRPDIVAFLAGVAIPLGLALAHALMIGFGDWWFAVIGHRAQTDSLIHGAFSRRFELFRDSLGPFARDLGVLVPLAAIGIVAARRVRRLALPLAWLLAAAAGFAVGGLYHPHYWVQLLAPLVVLAALGLDSLVDRHLVVAALFGVVAAVGPVVVEAPVYLASTGARVSELTLDDRRVTMAQPIGEYVRSISRREDRVAVVWADAAVLWYADRTPAFRYMWIGPLSQIHGAAAAARATITGPDPPEVVVVATRVHELDPQREVARALAQRYRLVDRIGPYPIYRLRPALPPPRLLT